MAYIGRDIEYGVLEKQSLTADGTSTDFTLNYGVGSSTALIVSVGGIVQEPDVGYTTSGSTISFATAPATGDGVFVVFIERELITSTAQGTDWVAHEVETGDGSTTQFTLSYSPTQAQDLAISLNGINQTPGTDFTVSGTTLTFSTAPANGLQILIYHLAESGGAGNLADGSVTNPKIVSMDASKLTGSMPSEIQADSFAAQYQDLSTLALHWASVDNKVAMNLTDDFIDHFQDDSGWDAYNGVDAVANSCLFETSQTHRMTKSSFQPTSPYTISFWIKRGSIGSTQFVYRIGSADNFGFNANNTISVERRSQSLTTTATFASTTDWVHFVIKSESSQCTLYADNVLVGTNSNAANPDSGGTFYIGGLSSTLGFQGHLAEFHYVQGLALDATSFGETRGGLWKPKSYTGSHGSTGFYLDFETANNLGQDKSGNGNDFSLSNLDSSDQTTVSPQPNAVANTGSENVYRASDEYVASGTQTIDSDWAYANDADQEIVDSSGNMAGVPGATDYVNAGSVGVSPYLGYFISPTYSTAHFYVDYLASYTWKGLKVSFKGEHSQVKDWRIEYSNDGTNWTIMDQTGTTTSAWTEYTSTFVHDNNISVQDESNGVFRNVANAGASGALAGGIITFGTPVSARYLKMAIDSNFYLNSGDPTVGIDSFIPFYDTTTTTATGSLVSTTSTADSTVSKATGVMLYKDGEGTNTIGTDLKAYFSADDGSNWTEAASYGSPTTFDGTTKVIPLGETTMSNTGTAVKLKAAWANQQASSGSAKIISPIGDATHSTSLVKVGNSSMYFDGTNDSLTVADSADFDFGTGDFTIEFWLQWAGNSQYHTIYDHNYSGSSAGTSGLLIQTVGSNDTTPQIKVWVNGTALTSTTAFGRVGDNQWYHFAVVRNSGTTTIYKNGVADGSSGSLSGNITPPAMDISIGSELPGSENDQGFSLNARLDEFRVSNSARYTSTFIPSTTAFTSDANTVLLIHSNESSESTTFIDSSSNTHAITAVGDAKHQSPVKKIGTSSLYFDGDGDYLSIPDDADFDFSGDFTVEFWMYNTVSNSSDHLIGNANHTTGANGGWAVYCNGTGILKFRDYLNGVDTTDFNVGWSANTWHHVCVTRESGTIKVWLDGQMKKSISHATAITGSNVMGIGSDGATASMYYSGYMDEIRVSDTARYTANFTPSTTAFTTDANTKLLIHGDDTLGTIARTSSADRWAGLGTSHVTFSGSNIKATTGDKQIYIPEVITGDFEITGTWYGSTGVNSAGQSVSRGFALGVFATSETYTDANALATANMTQVWYYDAPNQGSGAGDSFGYAQASQGSFTPTNGDTFKMCRIGSTFYWYFADTLRHTWTQTYSGPVRIVLNWSGVTNIEILNFAWSGDLKPIIDSSPVVGKIAQLHGWAVNY